MSVQRRLAVGSSVVALTAVLVGCGSSAPTAQVPAGAASTPVVTATPTPSPSPTAVFTVTAATFVDAMNAAAVRATSCAFTLEATDSTGTISANGVTRVAADRTNELAMTLTSPSTGAVDLRVVGGVWYIGGAQLTGGKFVKGDPHDPSGPFAGMTGIFDSVNPNLGMASDQGAVVAVTAVGGTEALGGVPTQAYDVVVDTSRLTPAVRAQQFDDSQALPAQVTYRFWFGQDGLVRKMVTDVQGSHEVMTFSGWGEPVQIQAPPANQVVAVK